MGNFIPVKGTDTNINNHPTSDGQLLFTTDSGKLFLDSDNKRIEITDFINLDKINPFPNNYTYFENKVYIQNYKLYLWDPINRTLNQIAKAENKIVYATIFTDDQNVPSEFYYTNGTLNQEHGIYGIVKNYSNEIEVGTFVISEDTRTFGICKGKASDFNINQSNWYIIEIISDDTSFISQPNLTKEYYFSNNNNFYRNGSIKYPYNSNDIDKITYGDGTLKIIHIGNNVELKLNSNISFNNVKFIGQSKESSKIIFTTISELKFELNNVLFENIYIDSNSNDHEYKTIIGNNSQIVSFINCNSNENIEIQTINDLSFIDTTFKNLILKNDKNFTIENCIFSNVNIDNSNINEEHNTTLKTTKITSINIEDSNANIVFDNMLINGNINIQANSLEFISGSILKDESELILNITDNISLGTFDYSKCSTININGNKVQYNKQGLSSRQIYNDSGKYTDNSQFEENELFYRKQYEENNTEDEDYNEVKDSISLHNDLIKIDKSIKKNHDDIDSLREDRKTGFFNSEGAFLTKEELDSRNDYEVGDVMKYVGENPLTLDYDVNININNFEEKIKNIDENLKAYELDESYDLTGYTINNINDSSEFPIYQQSKLHFTLSNDETYYILSSTDSSISGTIIIPHEYDDGTHGKKPVKVIGTQAFASRDLISVVIPSSVETIEIGAFINCSFLEEVITGIGLKTIENYAFEDCIQLKYITLSYTCDDVGIDVFAGCNNLSKIKYIGIPEDYKNVFEDSSFIANNQSFADLNFSINYICNSNVVNKWFNYDINNNNVENLRVKNNNVDFGYLILPNEINVIVNSELKTFPIVSISDFYNCTKLQEIEIPNNCIRLGYSSGTHNGCFEGCTSLTKVIIPEGLMYIYNKAFKNCTNLQHVNIPETCVYIGDNAFAYCGTLNNVALPNNLQYLGDECFAYCTEIKHMVIPESIIILGERTFYTCSKLVNIKLPSLLTEIGQGCFQHCVMLEYIDLPNGPQSLKLQNNCFYDCSSLQSIIIHSNTTYIGHTIFDYCTNLKFIILENNITNTTCTIESDAFTITGESQPPYRKLYLDKLSNTTKQYMVDIYGSSSLNSIHDITEIFGIGTGITIANSNSGSTGIRGSVVIPKKNSNLQNITTISSFTNSTYITKIIMSDQITNISASAFKGCTGLSFINLSNNITKINASTFEGCSSLLSIKIPEGVTEIKSKAFKDCTMLETIIIPDSVTTIASDAFDNCSALTIYCKKGSAAETYCDNNGSINHSYMLTYVDTGTYIYEMDYKYTDDGYNIDYDGYYSVSASSTISNGSHTIPNSYIGGYIHESNNGITTNTSVSPYITKIKTFANKTNITGISCNTYITKIEDGAFQGCEGLTTITLPNNIDTISKKLFKGCTSLTSITLPKYISKIDESAFENCTSLSNITLTENNFNNLLKFINKNAFKGCTNLTRFELFNPINVETGAFDNIPNIIIYCNYGDVIDDYCNLNNITHSYQLVSPTISVLYHLLNEGNGYSVGYYYLDEFTGSWELFNANSITYTFNIPLDESKYMFKTNDNIILNLPVYDGTETINNEMIDKYLYLPIEFSIYNVLNEFIVIRFSNSDFNNACQVKAIEFIQDNPNINNETINKLSDGSFLGTDIFINSNYGYWKFEDLNNTNVQLSYEIELNTNDRILRLTDNVWDKLSGSGLDVVDDDLIVTNALGELSLGDNLKDMEIEEVIRKILSPYKATEYTFNSVTMIASSLTNGSASNINTVRNGQYLEKGFLYTIQSIKASIKKGTNDIESIILTSDNIDLVPGTPQYSSSTIDQINALNYGSTLNNNTISFTTTYPVIKGRYQNDLTQTQMTNRSSVTKYVTWKINETNNKVVNKSYNFYLINPFYVGKINNISNLIETNSNNRNIIKSARYKTVDICDNIITDTNNVEFTKILQGKSQIQTTYSTNNEYMIFISPYQVQTIINNLGYDEKANFTEYIVDIRSASYSEDNLLVEGYYLYVYNTPTTSNNLTMKFGF